MGTLQQEQMIEWTKRNPWGALDDALQAALYALYTIEDRTPGTGADPRHRLLKTWARRLKALRKEIMRAAKEED
jgi:hypothetical protein